MVSAEAAGGPQPRQHDLVLKLSGAIVDVRPCGDVLEIRREELAARAAHALEWLAALRQYRLPILLARARGVDEHHAAGRRAAIRLGEKRVTGVVDDAIAVVPDFAHQRPPSAPPRPTANEECVALVSLAAVGDGECGEALVLRRGDDVKALRIGLVLEHERVRVLPRSNAVE